MLPPTMLFLAWVGTAAGVYCAIIKHRLHEEVQVLKPYFVRPTPDLQHASFPGPGVPLGIVFTIEFTMSRRANDLI